MLFNGVRVISLVSLCTILLGAAVLRPIIAAVPTGLDDQVQKEIEAAYAKRDKAFKEKDIAAIRAMETSDYKEKSKDGVVDRATLDPQVDQLMAMIKEVKVLFTTVEKISEGKDSTEVIADATTKGDFTFKIEDGSVHEQVASAKVRDIWVKTKEGWKIRFHETLEAAMLLDGKPVG